MRRFFLIFRGVAGAKVVGCCDGQVLGKLRTFFIVLTRVPRWQGVRNQWTRHEATCLQDSGACARFDINYLKFQLVTTASSTGSLY